MVIDDYRKALAALDTALKVKKDDISRDASIQRFEFCVELAWKTAKKRMGTSSTAPKVVIREMAQAGLIDSPETWFKYLEGRNLSSHTYREALAEEIYSLAVSFLEDGKRLLSELEKL